MSNAIIRPAQAVDVPVLLRFIQQLAELEQFPEPLTVNQERLQQHLFGARPVAEALLIESELQPIGYVIYYMNFASSTGSPGLHIDDLFILPAAQGQGLGKQIMKHVAQLARERACTRIEWWALRTNLSAQQFYRQLGAEQKNELLVYRLDGERLRNF